MGGRGETAAAAGNQRGGCEVVPDGVRDVMVQMHKFPSGLGRADGIGKWRSPSGHGDYLLRAQPTGCRRQADQFLFIGTPGCQALSKWTW